MNNETLKQIFVGLGILALLIAGVAFWRFVGFYGASIDPSSIRSFTVSAEGRAVTVPDIAEINLSVLTQGSLDLENLQQQNTTKTNNLIEFVKGNDVEEKDIKTTNYNISPRYERCISRDGQPCPPPEIVGYSIQQTINVKVRDFSNIGTILSGAVTRGANSVSGPHFTIDDPAETQSQARAQAIERAQEKAASIAEQAGFSLGRLISINEGSSYPAPRYQVLDFSEDGEALGGSIPSIEPGSEEVNVQIMLRYEIR